MNGPLSNQDMNRLKMILILGLIVKIKATFIRFHYFQSVEYCFQQIETPAVQEHCVNRHKRAQSPYYVVKERRSGNIRVTRCRLTNDSFSKLAFMFAVI